MDVTVENVVDELCACGKARSEHEDLHGVGGHGPCKESRCDQFTWVRFVALEREPDFKNCENEALVAFRDRVRTRWQKLGFHTNFRLLEEAEREMLSRGLALI